MEHGVKNWGQQARPWGWVWAKRLSSQCLDACGCTDLYPLSRCSPSHPRPASKSAKSEDWKPGLAANIGQKRSDILILC